MGGGGGGGGICNILSNLIYFITMFVFLQVCVIIAMGDEMVISMKSIKQP